MKKHIIVVGAGMGGMAAAIRLQHAGYQVEIYEKNDQPGGKMHQIKKDGYTFDVGPSIVMTPEIYRDVFTQVGKDPDDYIPMEKLDPMYNSIFGQEETMRKYTVSSDLTKIIEMIEAMDSDDAEGFLSYLQDIYERSNVAKKYFIQRPFRKPTDMYNPHMIKQAFKLKTFDSAAHSIGKFVQNKDLQHMLSFQTLYIGVSPNDGPSLYSMIPMLELLYGVWYIKGGMHTMASGMARLFEELGGRIFYNQEVSEIIMANRQARGIRIGQKEITADHIICNADFPYAMKHLFKEDIGRGKYKKENIDQLDYSCSCFILYLGMTRKYPEIDMVHNFFMSEDLDNNIDQIFNGQLIDDPSFYMYMPSKIDATMAPKDKDGFFLLVPVSELTTATYSWDQNTVNYYRDKVLDKLETFAGFEDVRQEIVSETIYTPKDFESQFNAYRGATFGLRPTLWQSNHFRPQVKQRKIDHLYFAGSSIHPGAGVPTVLTSGKIAADEVMLDDNIQFPDHTAV